MDRVALPRNQTGSQKTKRAIRKAETSLLDSINLPRPDFLKPQGLSLWPTMQAELEPAPEAQPVQHDAANHEQLRWAFEFLGTTLKAPRCPTRNRQQMEWLDSQKSFFVVFADPTTKSGRST